MEFCQSLGCHEELVTFDVKQCVLLLLILILS